MHHPPRVPGLVVALLTALTLFGVSCTGDEPRGASTATPRAGASATVTATATGTPEVDATPETVEPAPATLEALASAARDVERIRGLTLGGEVSQTFVTGAGMRTVLKRVLDDEETLELLREEFELLRELGLVEPDLDILEVYRTLLGGQVVGLYDPDTASLYVRTEGEPGALELSTYAHEYDHALQDAAFDLVALDEATERNRDAAIGLSALIEGEAVYTQTAYMRETFTPTQLLQVLADSLRTPQPDVPSIFMDMLQFPYTQGLSLVNALARQGAYEAIDAAFRDPPRSSEQVLHPEKYLAREAPVDVPAPVAPTGWTVTSGNVLGEYLLERWLRLVVGSDDPRAASAGWGGDRYVVLEGPGGATALLGTFAWDTRGDADEFMQALLPAATGVPAEGAAPMGDRALAASRVDERTVRVALAADEATARALLASSAR